MAYGGCLIWRMAILPVERTEIALLLPLSIPESLSHLAHLSISSRKRLTIQITTFVARTATSFVIVAEIEPVVFVDDFNGGVSRCSSQSLVRLSNLHR
jgi:hypothetical protein